MSIDELEASSKPKPAPRRRASSFTVVPKEDTKPIEEMNIDEMMAAAAEEPVPAKTDEHKHEFDDESEEESEVEEEIDEEIDQEEVWTGYWEICFCCCYLLMLLLL